MSDHKTKVKVINELAQDGRVTADDLLAEAKSESHPMHNDFEWDDTVAGHKYRLDQAREIIRTVRVTIIKGKKRVTSVAYVRDPDCKPNEQGYVSVAKVRTEVELAEEVFDNEISRIVMAYERAKELAIVLDLESDFNAAVETALKLQARTRRGPAKRQQQAEPQVSV